MSITTRAGSVRSRSGIRTLLVGASVSGLGSALLFAAPAAAWAAQWTWRPSVEVGAMRDDNLELTTGPHTSTSGYVVGARLDTEAKTETSVTKVLGAATHTNYSRADIEDKNERGLYLTSENRMSERGTLGFEGEYRHDAVFETSVVRPGTGDVRDTDIGLSTRTEIRRDYRTFQPSWNWLLTERSAIRFGYRWSDVSFSETAGTGLVNYQDHLISAAYSRQLTPKQDVTVSTNIARYEPDTAGVKAQTLQLLAGLTQAFSPNVKGSAAFGVSRTTETTPGNEDRSSGVVASATLRQTGELSTFEGVLSRDVTPSGIGRTLRSDQLRVYWTRQLAPEIEFVFNVQLLRTQLLEGSDPNANRTYYDIAPELRWRWLENTYVVGSVRYRKQKYESDPNSADSNAVFFGIRYSL
jgi:hypothetical protein